MAEILPQLDVRDIKPFPAKAGENEPLISLGEVADRLACEPDEALEYVTNEGLPIVYLGNDCKFLWSSVRDWFERRQVHYVVNFEEELLAAMEDYKGPKTRAKKARPKVKTYF